MRRSELPLRALPRVFLEGADMTGPVELSSAEADKLRKVLRLGTGDEIAVLPNDGSLWRCRLDGRSAVPESQFWPDSEPAVRITLAQGLPKADRLETALRMGTEIGIAEFVLFPAERSVVRWEAPKLEAKLTRLRAIVREAAEQSYRCRLPRVSFRTSLDEFLSVQADAIVLSEAEGIGRTLYEAAAKRFVSGLTDLALAVGPEGGWSPRELATIGERGVTLGPLVLRTDTAGPAAAASVLFGVYAAFRKNSDNA